MSTLTLRLPDELDRELERQSAASHVSKSDLAREALQRYLRVSRLRSLRARLVPRAQSQGIHTDEDVFRTLGKS
ncbi:MAG: ribbon-helix-helix protein, CopG family [Steroidobacteraceae bacterium]